MDAVETCVMHVATMLQEFLNGTTGDLIEAASEVSKLEHNADLVKNDIRNNLPRGLFMAIDRGTLLDILSLQDGLADRAEDIAVLMTFKPLTIPKWMQSPLAQFIEKNFEAFTIVREIIKELTDLAETGFGGSEAARVETLVDQVALFEHEADVVQRELLRSLFAHELELTAGDLMLWSKLFSTIGGIGNIAENLADRVRTILVTR